MHSSLETVLPLGNASRPIAMFDVPVVRFVPALTPIPVLLLPVDKDERALTPIAVLFPPVLAAPPIAPDPIAVLLAPPVANAIAFVPIAVTSEAVVTRAAK